MDGAGEAATDKDWGPFGRPLFDAPSSRALSRVGVVDVGSNSVRMVVFDGAARSPAIQGTRASANSVSARPRNNNSSH